MDSGDVVEADRLEGALVPTMGGEEREDKDEGERVGGTEEQEEIEEDKKT